MRPDLLTPEGVLDPGTLRSVLQLVEVTVDVAALEAWTGMEKVLAYDWAMREHLHASDNPVKRRAKPSFVTAAEEAAVREELADSRGYGEGPHIHEAVREILAEREVTGVTPKQILDRLAPLGLYPSRETLHGWLMADEHDGLVEEYCGEWRATERMKPMLYLSRRFPPEVELPDGEHIWMMSLADTARLRAWLKAPNGSFTAGRVTVEAAEGGGIMVRTQPWQAIP